jgi:NAD(P)-dependent dehydrogenase (short-subunit alcohol dehydrogenase family)
MVFLRIMKTYIITGAGSGIGRATAIALAGQTGNRIILVGRRENLLRETLGLMLPGPHLTACFDVRESSSWKELFGNLDGGKPTVEGLFANAGVGGENDYLANDRWDEIVSTNLTGTYISIQETLPYLRRSAQLFRHIVITSSCLARFGVSGYTAYCASKAGLLGLTRSLAVELASDHILVNAICPGWVDTEMARNGIALLARREGEQPDVEWQKQKELVPLRRFSEPDEIAELILFLFSGKQTSMTGQALDINNGSYMN